MRASDPFYGFDHVGTGRADLDDAVQPPSPESFSVTADPRPGGSVRLPGPSSISGCTSFGVADEKVDDLLVVISELAANAVRELAIEGALPHGRRGVRGRSSRSSWRSRTTSTPRSTRYPRTAGISTIHSVPAAEVSSWCPALVDEVDVEVHGQRLCVRCRLAIADD